MDMSGGMSAKKLTEVEYITMTMSGTIHSMGLDLRLNEKKK